MENSQVMYVQSDTSKSHPFLSHLTNDISIYDPPDTKLISLRHQVSFLGPQVTSLRPQVTSLRPQGTLHGSHVTSHRPQVISLGPQLTSLRLQVQEGSLGAQWWSLAPMVVT